MTGWEECCQPRSLHRRHRSSSNHRRSPYRIRYCNHDRHRKVCPKVTAATFAEDDVIRNSCSPNCNIRNRLYKEVHSPIRRHRFRRTRPGSWPSPIADRIRNRHLGNWNKRSNYYRFACPECSNSRYRQVSSNKLKSSLRENTMPSSCLRCSPANRSETIESEPASRFPMQNRAIVS